MTQYELTVVLSPQLDSDKLASLVKLIEGLITKASGKIVESIDWGEKQLAYKIKGQDSGKFRHIVMDLDAKSLSELSGKLKLTKGVLRLLLVKKER
jgi:ribosomal protein S6